MFIPYFTITPSITKDIEAIGVVFGYFKAIQLPENYKKELISKVNAEAVHSSTAIEGNTLTQKQVEAVLGGKKITAEDQDIKEILNYNHALEYIQELVVTEEMSLSENIIRQINAIILNGIKESIAGKYRTKQVYVGDYLPPEHFKVPLFMREFVSWLKNPHPPNLSPLLYTGIVHYQLVAIHPFEDGNGRTARVLTTMTLILYGYDMTSFFALESYYNRNRKAYYEALDSADKHRVKGQLDLTRWLEYYVRGMLIEAERAKARIEEMLENDKSTQREVWLSKTQIKILKLTKEKGSAKTADFLFVTKLSRKGTYNALAKLVKQGLLRRKGIYKGSYYTITKKGLEYIKR